jgi:hypothetical protein
MSIPVRVKSGTIQIQDATLLPEGYEQVTSLSTATSLTVPSGARMALIQASVQSIRWRDDATPPTPSVGMRISAGEEFWYTGNLDAIQFIEEIAGGKLNVSYYSSE